LIFIALLSRVSAHSAGDETGITEHRVELAATADAHKSDAPVPMATTAPSPLWTDGRQGSERVSGQTRRCQGAQHGFSNPSGMAYNP
jgi:hypothetical protein